MTNTFVNSDLVTLLDATPIQRPSGYWGGGTRLLVQQAIIQPGTSDATTLVYRMIRVPTMAVIHKVEIALELNGVTATTFTGNLGLYWSDAGVGVDGTQAIYNAENTAVSATFFTYHLAAAAINTFTDETFQNKGGNSAADGFYNLSASQFPLWWALTSGGYQGLNSANNPKGPADSAWSGLGATTGSTLDFYNITKDPGGFLDIGWVASTTTNISAAATANFIVRATYSLVGG